MGYEFLNSSCNTFNCRFEAKAAPVGTYSLTIKNCKRDDAGEVQFTIGSSLATKAELIVKEGTQNMSLILNIFQSKMFSLLDCNKLRYSV